MIKIIYAGLLVLISTALLVFSKSKPVTFCNHETTGVVKETRDSSGTFLYIETADQGRFFPRIENEDVVLASGARVKICYDTLQILSNNASLIRLNEVTYLP